MGKFLMERPDLVGARGLEEATSYGSPHPFGGGG